MMLRDKKGDSDVETFRCLVQMYLNPAARADQSKAPATVPRGGTSDNFFALPFLPTLVLFFLCLRCLVLVLAHLHIITRD